MEMTHNEAKKEFNNGNIEKAWEIAQKDEGFIAGTTKEQWIEFMGGLIMEMSGANYMMPEDVREEINAGKNHYIVYHTKDWELSSTLTFKEFDNYRPFIGDYKAVAVVIASELGDCFRITNHIDVEWWHNHEVVRFTEGRSTSVGDLVYDIKRDQLFICASAGWVKVQWSKEQLIKLTGNRDIDYFMVKDALDLYPENQKKFCEDYKKVYAKWNDSELGVETALDVLKSMYE